MADETPDTPSDLSTPASAAPDPDSTPSDAVVAAGQVAPAVPALSGKAERARRDHLAKSQRAPRSAEERNAERLELRKHKAVARRRRREQEKAKRVASDAPKGTGTPPAPPKDTTPQMRTGTVVSAKPDKTITVRIDVARRHRKYHKVVRSTTKLHAHDETNDAGEGDVVRVSECRPLSRNKRWKLEEVLERAK
jgi:small subunit ribosomal protein S17